MEDNKKKTPLSAEELEQVTGGADTSLGLIDPNLVVTGGSNVKFKCKFCGEVFIGRETLLKHEARCPKKVQIF